MNPSTIRRTSFAQQLPEAEQVRVPLIGYPENIQNIYGQGMTLAVDFTKFACSTAVCMNSCLMDLYRHFFWYPMGLEYWFEAQKEAFAKGMEWGTQCLCAVAPQSAPARRVRGERRAAPRTREEQAAMEEGIDVAVDAFEEEILA